MLQPLKITLVKPEGFTKLMRQLGKFGGQNKVVHLSNNRKLVELIDENNIDFS